MPASSVETSTPHDGVRLIRLNRPERLNAFDRVMRSELLDALRAASNDDCVRAVVLSGKGSGFCAGADVTELGGYYNIEDVLNSEYAAFLNVIQTMPKPVLAAVNGVAAGIGMTLALTCDLRVMSADAYLMCAFANIGLVPDGGLSWLLTQQLGYARAYQVAVEAKKMDAARALDWGLINRVVPADHALQNTLDWAHGLAQRSHHALALTKRTFRAAADVGLRNAMASEAQAQRAAIETQDFAEGISAFIGKRKPVFAPRGS